MKMFCIKTTNKSILSLNNEFNKLLHKLKDKNNYINFLKQELNYSKDELREKYKNYKRILKLKNEGYDEEFEKEEYEKSQLTFSPSDEINLSFQEAKTETEVRMTRIRLEEYKREVYLDQVVQRYGFKYIDKEENNNNNVVNAPSVRSVNSQRSLVEFYKNKNEQLNKLVGNLEKESNIINKDYNKICKEILNSPVMVNQNPLEKPYQFEYYKNIDQEIIKEVGRKEREIEEKYKVKPVKMNHDYLNKFINKLKKISIEVKEENSEIKIKEKKKFKNEKEKEKYINKLKDQLYIDEGKLNTLEEDYQMVKVKRNAVYIISYSNYVNPISWFSDTKATEQSRKDYQKLTEEMKEIENKIESLKEEMKLLKEELGTY